tara:strand:+ start:21111 stop:21995 length:885 start_codon:yes stop_codon:yes gene_type:complete
MNSVKKCWERFKADHVVFCFEGRSWRKDMYPAYKQNRKATRDAMTPAEQEADKIFWETFDEFKTFVENKSNCTTLQHKELEADDLIAGWIQSHPDDNHIIVSSDSDFYQMIAENVSQYNGITDTLITIEGFYDDKNTEIIDKKTKLPKTAPNPEWLLFEKCMRGDSSDNVFSAFPKVRTTKLKEAFEDRNSQGFVWNNIMLSRWVDHNGKERVVKDEYAVNQQLIDLSQQPDNIKKIIAETIAFATDTPKEVANVGIHMLKFCNKHELVRIRDNVKFYAEPFNARLYQNQTITA